MNRFLKKEWEDTEVPERVRLRARNRAWTALQHSTRRAIPWGRLSAVASMVVLVVVVVFRTFGPGAAPETAELLKGSAEAKSPFEAPTAPKGIEGDSSEDVAGGGSEQIELGSGSPPGGPGVGTPRPIVVEDPIPQPDEETMGVARAQPVESVSGPVKRQRFVMNLRLPRSGVRMIWINENENSKGVTE